MPFFIAVVLLLALSSAYLLHQFWSKTLVRHDLAAHTHETDSDHTDALRAA